MRRRPGNASARPEDRTTERRHGRRTERESVGSSRTGPGKRADEDRRTQSILRAPPASLAGAWSLTLSLSGQPSPSALLPAAVTVRVASRMVVARAGLPRLAPLRFAPARLALPRFR